jgi:zinc/manganese transport system substrate-binding protein
MAAVVAGLLAMAGCGGDDSAAAGEDVPHIVVTSTILGDIVATVAGDAADVDVLLPIGADPHEFAPSVRQAEDMAEADLLVQNGAGFEGGLADTIAAAEDAGVPTFTVVDHVDLLPLDEGSDEGGPYDPHVWTDPSGLVPAVEALGARLQELTGDPTVVDRASAYVDELEALDGDIENTLSDIAPEDRVLVTNHEVFRYFADRYDFEVVGAVIPSMTTGDQPSAADIDELSATIAAEAVPAIFAETTSGADLAEALAETVGDVEVVTLFTESLGEPASGAETYLEMMRTDAELIDEALAR